MKCETCGGIEELYCIQCSRTKDGGCCDAICKDCNGSGIQPEQPEIDYSHPATPLIAEIKSKSIQKRLAVQKSEQQQVEDIMDFVEPEEYLKTEEEKIREAFEKIYKIPENVEFCFGNYHEKKRHEWGDYALTKKSIEYSEKFQVFYLGSKSKQPEIEEIKSNLKEYIKVSEDLIKKCENRNQFLSDSLDINMHREVKKDKQIEKLRNHNNCALFSKCLGDRNTSNPLEMKRCKDNGYDNWKEKP